MNNLLKERNKLYAKYAEHMPENANYVQVSFDPPKHGWICMHISVNYKEKCCLTLSADTEPFYKIREWLVDLVKSECNNSLTRVDCDLNIATFYFDPILYWNGYKGHTNIDGYCGLFYIYDTDGHKIIIDTLCYVKDIVKAFYISMINYCMEMKQNKDFVEEWLVHSYGDPVDDDGEPKDLMGFFFYRIQSDLLDFYLRKYDK